MSIDAEAVEDLVRTYQESDDPTVRDRALSDVIAACEPMIEGVCAKHLLPAFINDPDRLIQTGREAVALAADDWDPSSGHRFVPYAAQRVRWEIRRAEMTEWRFRKHHSDEKPQPALAASSDADPAAISEADVEVLDRRELAHRLVSTLAGREREIVLRTFWDGETLTQVAQDLGISVARASQIRSEALERLRQLAA